MKLEKRIFELRIIKRVEIDGILYGITENK